jgi:hypothetical protein
VESITGYNSSNPTTEFLNRTSATAFDAGVGLLYYDAEPEKKPTSLVVFLHRI